MTPDRLEQIRERVSKATPGPWHGDHDEYGCVVFGNYGWVCPGNGPAYDEDSEQGKADAEFVGHARTDVPDLLAEVERLTADVAQLQAAGLNLTHQLRQAKEERAAVALERDELISERELAVLARDQWAMDVVVYHDIPAEPGDDLYASIAKYIKARKAEAESLREQLVHFANGMQERNRRAERVAEAAKTARDLFGPQPHFGGFRELAAAVDEWQRTQEESRG